MKRIQSACLNLTLKFDEGAELTQYKATLAQKGTPCRIYEERQQPDGSVLVRLKKQYSGYQLGDYLTDEGTCEEEAMPL